MTGTTINHATSITAGTTPSTVKSGQLASGDTFYIPKITYNATGHITGVDTLSLTLPSVINVKQDDDETSTGNYPILTSYLVSSAESRTGTAKFNQNVFINPSTGNISSGGLSAYGMVISSSVAVSSIDDMLSAGATGSFLSTDGTVMAMAKMSSDSSYFMAGFAPDTEAGTYSLAYGTPSNKISINMPDILTARPNSTQYVYGSYPFVISKDGTTASNEISLIPSSTTVTKANIAIKNANGYGSIVIDGDQVAFSASNNRPESAITMTVDQIEHTVNDGTRSTDFVYLNNSSESYPALSYTVKNSSGTLGSFGANTPEILTIGSRSAKLVASGGTDFSDGTTTITSGPITGNTLSYAIPSSYTRPTTNTQTYYNFPVKKDTYVDVASTIDISEASAVLTDISNSDTTTNNIVHKTGTETITGTKTFSSTISGSISGNAATVTTTADAPTGSTTRYLALKSSESGTLADLTKYNLSYNTYTDLLSVLNIKTYDLKTYGNVYSNGLNTIDTGSSNIGLRFHGIDSDTTTATTGTHTYLDIGLQWSGSGSSGWVNTPVIKSYQDRILSSGSGLTVYNRTYTFPSKSGMLSVYPHLIAVIASAVAQDSTHELFKLLGTTYANHILMTTPYGSYTDKYISSAGSNFYALLQVNFGKFDGTYLTLDQYDSTNYYFSTAKAQYAGYVCIWDFGSTSMSAD